MTQPMQAAPPPVAGGWQPLPPKPPLSARARRGAQVAGGVAFPLHSLGWTLLFGSLLLGFIGGVFVWVAQLIRLGGPDAGDREFVEFVESVDAGLATTVLVITGVVGLGLVVLSLFVSRWILGRHGVAQPWGVTWAATGISILASWFLGGILSVFAQLATPVMFSGPDPVAGAVVSAVVSAVTGLALAAAIGVFAWWWMAHVLRARAEAATDGGGA